MLPRTKAVTPFAIGDVHRVQDYEGTKLTFGVTAFLSDVQYIKKKTSVFSAIGDGD